MPVDPKSRKSCEWCGRTMRPHYNPNRGRYESEHWERPKDWAKRRFCSRRCQNFVMARRRVYVEIHKERNDEIWRLRGLGLSFDRIAAEVGATRSMVVGALHRRREKADGKRVTMREIADREKAALDVAARRRAWRRRRARFEAARRGANVTPE